MKKVGVPSAGTTKRFKGFRTAKNRTTPQTEQTPVGIRHGSKGSWAGSRHFSNKK